MRAENSAVNMKTEDGAAASIVVAVNNLTKKFNSPMDGKEFVVLGIPCNFDCKFSFCHDTLGIEESNKRIDLLVCPSMIFANLGSRKHFPDFR